MGFGHKKKPPGGLQPLGGWGRLAPTASCHFLHCTSFASPSPTCVQSEDRTSGVGQPLREITQTLETEPKAPGQLGPTVLGQLHGCQ